VERKLKFGADLSQARSRFAIDVIGAGKRS
jgi:hypothetical protein